MAQVFAIDVTRTAYEHLASFRRYDRSRVLDAIREQLTHRPTQETRNKKMLRDNPVSDWELRVHPFRVFYEVNESDRHVRILAVGVKEHNKLIIGGKEVEI